MINIELEVLGLSYSQTQTGAYALVLAEKEGKRRIPIIIGSSEAQSIAVQLEGLTPLRPLTHDLLVNIASSFAISIIKVNITKLEEGIFYSELVCERGGNSTIIDARTSDAVALALRFKCPIYTNEEILNKAGIILEDSKNLQKPEKRTIKKPKEDLTNKSLEELDKLLEDAISKEDYEKASKIRDEIKKKSTE
jgi:bifunctional DNase/RNase